MTEIVIASGARTPTGSFNGVIANVPACKLGALAKLRSAFRLFHVIA
ncbi:MAG: hypothetical protein KGI68_04385 [Alphaproteobacteria bacterium]|nr:hypothetical protein [Alphaproteobacteria bacterium]MDE2265945.1 hypothetical protein [Alphaproteobacteria bacterium]MDE2501219.1 hypothetical protein [Alphaproteobacteria bacterium]